jgi:hypothetical protein
MNQALKAQPRDEEVELRLRLKEAYMRLREGDTQTAVSTLQNTPQLVREVLKFYKETGMDCGKISVFKHTLRALELVGRISPCCNFKHPPTALLR